MDTPPSERMHPIAYLLGLTLRLFRSPWMLLVPGVILVVSVLIYQSAASEIREKNRTWEMGLKLEIESLQHVIGSRSGENSAKAAAGGGFIYQPVFADELRQLKAATDRLQQGASGYGSGLNLNGPISTQENCIGWMIVAGLSTLVCALGLATRPKGTS